MAPVKAAVFGSGGFIGSRLAAHLRALGWEVLALGRGDDGWRGRELGHVFYCVGLTADFRARPFETIEAHVGFAAETLRAARFDSFLYLSSTRVYAKSPSGEESAVLGVDPSDPSDLYNLSKLTGEAACLALDRPEVRIARLSNVFGSGMGADNFLMSILRSAAGAGAVELGQAPDSAKDYVSIDDVLPALVKIAAEGRERLYNVASGRDVAHGELLAAVQALTGCEVRWRSGGPTVRFPPIAVQRLSALGITSGRGVLEALPQLLAARA